MLCTGSVRVGGFLLLLLTPSLPWPFVALKSDDGRLTALTLGATGAPPFDCENLAEEDVSEVIKLPSNDLPLGGLEDAEPSRLLAAWDICWTLTISVGLKARTSFEYPASRTLLVLVFSAPGPIILDAASIISAAFLLDT